LTNFELRLYFKLIAAENRFTPSLSRGGLNPIEVKSFDIAALCRKFYFMPLTKQKKTEIMKDLKERLKDAKIIVFVNFHGLNTALTRDIKRLLTKAEAKYIVAKKTLIKKVLEEFKFAGEIPELDGEVALVVGKGDAVLPVKEIAKFGKAHPEITFLGGIFEKAFLGKESVAGIAKLPAREVLLAQLLNVISSPQRGLVGALSGVQRKFVIVLSQIKK